MPPAGAGRVAVALACFLLLLAPSRAAAYDPARRWYTLETEHFRVHFHDGLELFARGGGAAEPPLALNLAPARAEAARGFFEDPAALLHNISAIYNSRLVQEEFAPAVGASEVLPIARLTAKNASLARALARASKQAGPGGDLPPSAELQVRRLYGLPPVQLEPRDSDPKA